MASRLGSIEIDCDAPPYLIVQACLRVGFHKPEDVRWCRLSHFLRERQSRTWVLNFRAWGMFLSGRAAWDRSCNCKQKLPSFEKYTFTLSNGEQRQYCMGQCRKCQTIFWDEL